MLDSSRAMAHVVVVRGILIIMFNHYYVLDLRGIQAEVREPRFYMSCQVDSIVTGHRRTYRQNSYSNEWT